MLDVFIPHLSFLNLLFILAGVGFGFILGSLPGMDITTGVALLLPLSYAMTPLNALILFVSIYCSGVFAGAITAILFNIPGTSESVMTAIEGHPFTQRGHPGLALGTSIVCSGLGGIAATVVLMLAAPLLARVALRFGPFDYAALGMLGMACVSALLGASVLKGTAAALLGLFLGTIGLDKTDATARFVWFDGLLDGVNFVAAIIGLFAVTEVPAHIIWQRWPHQGWNSSFKAVRYPPWKTYLKLRFVIFRSWLVGVLVGIIPGVGASSAAFISHGFQAQLSHRSASLNKGSLQGVAAAETANNAAAVGSLVPLLALGIPGSATAAVLLGVFSIHDLQPGPLLFTMQPELIHTLFWSVLLANLAFMVLAFFITRWLAQAIRLPYALLATVILTVSVTGALAMGGMGMLLVMACFAVLGLLFRLGQVPIVPLVLGLVLGPIIETYFRRGLLMEHGELQAVLHHPLAVVFLTLALIVLIAPVLWRIFAHIIKG